MCFAPVLSRMVAVCLLSILEVVSETEMCSFNLNASQFKRRQPLVANGYHIRQHKSGKSGGPLKLRPVQHTGLGSPMVPKREIEYDSAEDC